MSFFFNCTATTEIYTLSLHDALPIYQEDGVDHDARDDEWKHQKPDEEQPNVLPADDDPANVQGQRAARSEEHTSELQSRRDLVCRLLLEKKKHNNKP